MRTSISFILWAVIAPAFAGISEDQDAFKHIQFCYGVYTAAPFSQYVLQRDMDDLNRADAKLRGHVKSQYSADDANKLTVNGSVDGFLLKPKHDADPDKVVKACRRAIGDINHTY